MKLARNVLPSYRWVVLALTTYSQAAVSFVALGIPALAPYIQSAFGLTRAQVGVFASAIFLGSTTAVMIVGRAVDQIGEGMILALGAAFMGILITVVALIRSYHLALAVLVVCGLAASAATPAGGKAVLSWFPLRDRGVAMGVRQTGVPLGGMLAAIILPRIAESFGWRPALMVAGVVAVSGAAACYLWYTECPFRWSDGAPPDPVSPVSRVFTLDLGLLGITAMVYAASQHIIITYLQLFLGETMAISMVMAANALALVNLAGCVGRIGWGWLSDKAFGGRRRDLISWLGWGIAAAVMGLLILGRTSPVALPMLLAVALGLTAVGWNGLLITMLAELSPDHAGASLGIGLAFAGAGIVLGPPVFGYIADVTGSYRLGWLLVVVLAMIGAVSARAVRERLNGSRGGTDDGDSGDRRRTAAVR